MGQWVTLYLLVVEAFSHQSKHRILCLIPGLVTLSASEWAVPGEVTWSPSGLSLHTTSLRSLYRSFALYLLWSQVLRQLPCKTGRRNPEGDLGKELAECLHQRHYDP